MKKTAIVTLTYNKLEVATKPFIESLYEYTSEDEFDFIIVDNASTDGTREYLESVKASHNNITLILNEENVGYSKGNNQGIKAILDKDYEYIGLLNNDIMFTPNWLKDTLSIFEKDKQLGMVSPRIQKHKSINKQNYLSKYKNYLKKFKGDFSYSLAPLFCCVFVKKEVIEKIGLMDENYTPAFWEDQDYIFRTFYAGYSLARSNLSFVFHNHSQTSKSVPSEIFKRNEKYFFNKHPLARWVFSHQKTSLLKDIVKYFKDER